jgi:hypothetical protein
MYFLALSDKLKKNRSRALALFYFLAKKIEAGGGRAGKGQLVYL